MTDLEMAREWNDAHIRGRCVGDACLDCRGEDDALAALFARGREELVVLIRSHAWRIPHNGCDTTPDCPRCELEAAAAIRGQA